MSPAALRRLLRSPTIAEPASELISLITYGLPKVALEVGAELPELSQIADVIDLEPQFRMDGSQFDRLWNDGDRFSIGDVSCSVLAPSHRTGPTSDWYTSMYGFALPSCSTTRCTLAPTSCG